MTQERVADATTPHVYNSTKQQKEVKKIGLGKIKRIWSAHEKPTADEMLRLCEALGLPKVRMLAELGLVAQESDREAYIDQLEEIASRITYTAGLVEVEQPHAAAVIAARIVATGKYEVTITPLMKGTDRFRRHCVDLVAARLVPGQSADGIREHLGAELRTQLAWFHAGFIGMPETAEALGLQTPDVRAVIDVPRFLAARLGFASCATPPLPLCGGQPLDRIIRRRLLACVRLRLGLQRCRFRGVARILTIAS